MVTFYNNLSPTTKLLIQSFLAVLGSVLVGTGTAAYQSYTATGHIDIASIWVASSLAFALLFGKAMHDWIPPHAQQLIQTATEEKAALYNALQQAQTVAGSAIASQSAQVASVSPQSVQQPHVIVQPASGLKVEDIQAISAQLAINLMHMAGNSAQEQAPIAPAAPPLTPATPVPDPYYDPMRVSALLPAYTPPTAIPDQATQSVQVPFPAQSAIMP